MKKLFTILLLFIGFIGYSQSVVQRASPANTVDDPNGMSSRSKIIPRYQDTTQANTLYSTLDSAGKIIYTYDVKGFWYRQHNPKRWIRVISTNNLGSDFFFDSTCDCMKIDTTALMNIVNNFISDSSVINISILNDSTLRICYSNGSCVNIGIVTNITNISTVDFITDSSVKVCAIDTTGGISTTVCDTIVIGRQPITYTASNWVRLTNPNQFVFGSNSPNNNDNFLDNTTYANTGYYRMIWDSRTIYEAGHEFRKMDGFGFPNGTSLVNFFHPDGFLGHVNDVKLRVNYTADTVVRSPFIDGYLGDAIGYSLGANWQGHGGYGNYLDNSRSKTALVQFHTFDTTNTKGVTIYAAPNGLAATNNFVLKNYSIADFNTDKSVTLQGYGSGSSFISTDTTNNKPAAYDANGKLVRLDRWPGSGGGSITDVVTTDNFLSVTGTTTKTVNTKKLFGNLVSGATITKDASVRQNDTLHLADTANLVFTNLQSGDQGTIVVINDIANPELTVPDQIITLNSALGDTTILGWIYTGSYMIWATSASATGTGIAGIGTLDAQTKSANGGVFTLDSLYFQTADTTYPGLINTGTQKFEGIKTLKRYLVTDTISTSGSGNLTMLVPTGNFIIGTNAKFNFDQDNTALRIGTSTVRAGYQLQIHGFFSSGAGSTDAISELTTSSNTTGTTALQFNINNSTGIGSIKGYGPSFASTLFGQSLAGAMSITSTSGGVFINGFNGPIHMGTFGTSTPTFTISTSNRVGIKNITAPDSTLHVGGSGHFTGTLRVEALANAVGTKAVRYNTSTGTFTYADTTTNSITVITANNGLTASTSTNVQLGGTLIGNTTIATGAYTLNVTTSTSGVTPFNVSSNDQSAITSSSTSGNGIEVSSISGNAISASSLSGKAFSLTANPSSTNTIVTVGSFSRASTGTAANGIGGALDLYLNTTTSNQIANQMKWKWTDATDATRTSQLILGGVLSAAAVDILTLNADGSIQLRPITATAASAITPAEGMIVMVSSTDATFVSIGFWGYYNAAWHAL